jgi:SAM-dependent methyltransferase
LNLMNCACCSPGEVNNLDKTFNANDARKDARRYLKQGLDKRGRKLIAYIVAHCSEPVTVLDVGCGAGGTHHDLLRQGVASNAVGVDASSAYLAAAQANAAELGLSNRVTYQHADFAQTPEAFEPADVVIMDRVICCYPYLNQLLGAAAHRAYRYLALSFPVEAWWTRPAFWCIDAVLTVFGSKYRPFLHPHSNVVALAIAAGLQPVHSDRSGIWQIMVFVRPQ